MGIELIKLSNNFFTNKNKITDINYGRAFISKISQEIYGRTCSYSKYWVTESDATIYCNTVPRKQGQYYSIKEIPCIKIYSNKKILIVFTLDPYTYNIIKYYSIGNKIVDLISHFYGHEDVSLHQCFQNEFLEPLNFDNKFIKKRSIPPHTLNLLWKEEEIEINISNIIEAINFVRKTNSTE